MVEEKKEILAGFVDELEPVEKLKNLGGFPCVITKLGKDKEDNYLVILCAEIGDAKAQEIVENISEREDDWINVESAIFCIEGKVHVVLCMDIYGVKGERRRKSEEVLEKAAKEFSKRMKAAT